MNHIFKLACIVIYAASFQSLAVTQSLQISANNRGATTATSALDAIVEYTFVFSQFTPQQVADIQSFMRVYSHYESITVIKQNSLNTQLRYRSKANVDVLLNNMRKTTEYLGFEVLLRSAGTEIDVRFIQLKPKSLPYQEW